MDSTKRYQRVLKLCEKVSNYVEQLKRKDVQNIKISRRKAKEVKKV